MDKKFSLKKAERISLKKEIECLFKQGEVFISYPLRVVFLKQKPFSDATVSILISVSKKKFKHSVKRNLMKRLIKEVYRLNKTSLIQHLQEKDNGLLIAFIFIGNELYKFNEIEIAMQKALNILKEKTE